jgi:uncharacterized membrane protein
MKNRHLTLILILLILVDPVGAQEILDYNIKINVDGMSLHEDVTITVRNNHETSLRKITYPFSGEVVNLKTFDDLGGLESEVELRGGKNFVTAELRNLLPHEATAKILYEFEDPSAITFFNNTYILSTTFPLLANVQKFTLELKLPEGTGLGDPNVDIVPAPSEITSDGRAVILRWDASNPSDFRIFVRFELLPPPSTEPPNTQPPQPQAPADDFTDEKLIIGALLGLILIFSALIAIKLRSRIGIEEKIDILKEDEQAILKLVSDEDGIPQREIQRRTDFSKTKVSKILTELENRGAIRKEPVGKKNKVYLTEKLKE